MAMVPWTQEQKDHFVEWQFGLQRTHYRLYYPESTWDILLIDGVRAGRLYVHRKEESVHILDITLMAEFRGKGMGSSILRHLQQEAASGGKTLSIHVERYNPAKRLYDRLGFEEAGESGPVYLYMEWRAPSAH